MIPETIQILTWHLDLKVCMVCLIWVYRLLSQAIRPYQYLKGIIMPAMPAFWFILLIYAIFQYREMENRNSRIEQFTFMMKKVKTFFEQISYLYTFLYLVVVQGTRVLWYQVGPQSYL